MPITAQLSRLVVYGLPLAFVVFSWLASASLPALLEREESFLTGLHARSAEIMPSHAAAPLTVRTVGVQRVDGAATYTQVPNAPRLLHYLLQGAGVRDAAMQILIICLIGSTLTTILLWRLFGHPALFVVPLAVVLDYAGFLAWTLNASRIWMFVIFFGMALAVKSSRPFWFGALAFCLIALDFRIATFVGATMLAFALLVHRGRGWRLVVAGLVGAALPLGIFAAEVLVFYGYDELRHEILVGSDWVSTLGAGEDGFRYLFQAVHGPILLLQTVARDTHNVMVVLLVVAGVVSAFFAMSRYWITEQHRFLVNLTVSAVIGTTVASSVLYTHFVESFVGSTLPLASFLIAPALGTAALELQTLLGRLRAGRHLGTIALAIVLVPLVMSSIVRYDPPIEAEPYRFLRSGLRQSVVAGWSIESWFAVPARMLARTGDLNARTSEAGQDRSVEGRRNDP